MTDNYNPPPEYSAPPPPQFQPAPGGWEPTPEPPPAPRKSRKLAWIIIAVVVLLGAIGGGAAVLLNKHDQKKSGFYTAADLEPSVSDELQGKLDDAGAGGTVDSVGCVDTGTRTWDCHVDISGGDGSVPSALDLVVNVASNHQTWVSHDSG